MKTAIAALILAASISSSGTLGSSSMTVMGQGWTIEITPPKEPGTVTICGRLVGHIEHRIEGSYDNFSGIVFTKEATAWDREFVARYRRWESDCFKLITCGANLQPPPRPSCEAVS